MTPGQRSKFDLGDVKVTQAASVVFDELGDLLEPYLTRYQHQDWGDTGPLGRTLNEMAVRLHDGPVIAWYTLRDQRTLIVIATETDRSGTEVSLAEE